MQSLQFDGSIGGGSQGQKQHGCCHAVSDRSSPPVKLDYRSSRCLFHFEYLPLAKRRFLGWLCGGRCWCDCVECQNTLKKSSPNEINSRCLKSAK
jgi:hypothetical protein